MDKEILEDKIKMVTLSKLKLSSSMRNEFGIMSFIDFTQKLDGSFFFKNKFYFLIFFEKASGSINIDGQKFELHDGIFFFINYNQVYNINNANVEKGDILLFTKSFYNYIYTGNKKIKSDSALNNVPSCLMPKGVNSADIIQTFRQLREEFYRTALLKKEIICLLLKVLMLKYIRSTNKKSRFNKTINHRDDIVEEFLSLVEQNFKEKKMTSQYAEMLHLTANYLNVLVKDKLDIPATQVIKNRIILEAERLLLHTTLSVVEISFELGFSDNSHFGKYFKSATKFSPKKYRIINAADFQ